MLLVEYGRGIIGNLFIKLVSKIAYWGIYPLRGLLCVESIGNPFIGKLA